MSQSEPRSAPAAPEKPPRERWFSLALAWASLTWERFWSAFWPLGSVLLLILAVAFSGLTERIPGWTHGLILLLALGLVLWTIRINRPKFVLPPLSRSWRTLEDSRKDLHRPLTATRDSMSLGAADPLSEALWQAHQNRMQAATQDLYVRFPRPDVVKQDPTALRFAPVLLCVLSLAIAGPVALDRLWQFVTPSLLPPDSPVSAELWITPPDYTGQVPLHLSAQRPAPETPEATDAGQTEDGTEIAEVPLRVPEGSSILVLVRGEAEAVHLGTAANANPETANSTAPLDQVSALDHRLETELSGDGPLTLWIEDDLLLSRPLTIVEDQPPEISFAKEPGADQRARLVIEALALDDYGVTAAQAFIRPTDPDAPVLDLADPGADQVLVQPFNVGGGGPGVDGVGSTEALRLSADLTDHLWAGLEVSVTLEARDHPDQVSQSEPTTLLLPERVFRDPMAQA
ncbi:MAG: DUF4175 family protein, partial [Rhodospirillaceae bacterium]